MNAEVSSNVRYEVFNRLFTKRDLFYFIFLVLIHLFLLFSPILDGTYHRLSVFSLNVSLMASALNSPPPPKHTHHHHHHHVPTPFANISGPCHNFTSESTNLFLPLRGRIFKLNVCRCKRRAAAATLLLQLEQWTRLLMDKTSLVQLSCRNAKKLLKQKQKI